MSLLYLQPTEVDLGTSETDLSHGMPTDQSRGTGPRTHFVTAEIAAG